MVAATSADQRDRGEIPSINTKTRNMFIYSQRRGERERERDRALGERELDGERELENYTVCIGCADGAVLPTHAQLACALFVFFTFLSGSWGRPSDILFLTYSIQNTVGCRESNL